MRACRKGRYRGFGESYVSGVRKGVVMLVERISVLSLWFVTGP
jgi:hypothetical protein